MMRKASTENGIRRVHVNVTDMKKPAQGPPPPADLSGVPAACLDLPYAGESDSQKLDLFLPENPMEKLPLVIHIHGGAFMLGDKRDAQVQPFLEGLKRGYAVASINYRLSGEKIFPAAVHDCKCAVRWLRAHAREFGLDPDRFAAAGGSAGGNLSAMLAASAGTEELEDFKQGYAGISSVVQTCVDWFGPTDFLKMDRQLEELGLGPLDHNDADSPESLYMGGKITDLPPEWVQKANPVTYINDSIPPILIQHGEKDHLVCVQQSTIFYEAIVNKLGPGWVRYEIIEDADHADIHFSTSRNMERVFTFLDEHLKGNNDRSHS